MPSARQPIISGNTKAVRRDVLWSTGCAPWRRSKGSSDELLDEQEKIMANMPADLPAVLTKEARGG